mmetsp:Transcript_95565/g.270365  ORF Transcript_95565/g.270365 Transcript_95565/m.270365 type:complete len:306 (-) Transcript_95565:2509-3426(-)
MTDAYDDGRLRQESMDAFEAQLRSNCSGPRQSERRRPSTNSWNTDASRSQTPEQTSERAMHFTLSFMSSPASVGVHAQRQMTRAPCGSGSCPGNALGVAAAGKGCATSKNFWLLLASPWSSCGPTCCWMPNKLQSPAHLPTSCGNSSATDLASLPGKDKLTARAACWFIISRLSAMYSAMSSSDVGRGIKKLVAGRTSSSGADSAFPAATYRNSQAKVHETGAVKAARPRLALVLADLSCSSPATRLMTPEASASCTTTLSGNLKATLDTVVAAPYSWATRSQRRSTRNTCFFIFFERTHAQTPT